MSFNLNVSSRKEDVSIRLRAQNMRNAKGETKQLEMESRKMDERLMELKMAMTREKEERERHSQGFWGKGQTGVLASYAEDVLTKPIKTKTKGAKPKKVKVLKDEPIVIPVRNNGPGTLGFIAQQGGKENRAKVKGSRCGQCEHKAAQVSCRECAEDYCAGCFAAFHLKGALKKHRSVPLGSSDRRTPRQSSTRSNGPALNGNVEHITTVTVVPPTRDVESPARLGDIEVTFRSSSRQSNPPAASNGTALTPLDEASLLVGDYSEADSAASFQHALNKWRGNITTETKALVPRQPIPHPKDPREMVSVDCGTEDRVVSPQQRDHIEVMFHSNLTYAEKLLLKQHRRGQLPPGCSASGTQLHPSPGCSASGTQLRTPPGCSAGHSASEAQLRPSPDHSSGVTPSESGDSFISEGIRKTYTKPNVLKLLIDGPKNEDEEDELSVDECVEFASLYGARIQSHQLLKTIATGGVTVTEIGSCSLPSDDLEHSMSYQVVEGTPPVSPASQPSFTNLSMTSPLDHAAHLQQSGQCTEPLDGDMGGVDSVGNGSKVVQRSKPSDQSRPQSAAKARKETRPQSRANSRTQSRPQSRVQGYRLTPRKRPSSATSVYGDGNLTKAPSDPLRVIAQLSPRTTTIQLHDETDLGSFFTAGVEAQSEPFQERVLTPTGQRKHQVATPAAQCVDEKWKLSNKVYQMAPRSWRPESSLAVNVPEDAAANHLNDIGVTDIEQFMTAPLDGDVEKEVETISWSLSSNVVTTMSFMERPMTEGNESSCEYSPRPQTGGSTASPISLGEFESPSIRVAAMSPCDTPSGRVSQMIVVEGVDPSECDDTEYDRGQQDVDDIETLDQLGWELMSNDTSRVPDGAASRLSMLSINTYDEDDELSINDDLGRPFGLDTPEVNLEDSLLQQDLMDDFEDAEEQSVKDEVHALPI